MRLEEEAVEEEDHQLVVVVEVAPEGEAEAVVVAVEEISMIVVRVSNCITDFKLLNMFN